MPKQKKRKTHKKTHKKPSVLSIKNLVIILGLIVFAIFINLYVTNKEKIEEQQKNIKIQQNLLIKQEKLEKEKKLQEKQSKYFEEKTKAMEIEYVQEIDIEQKAKVIVHKDDIFIFKDDIVKPIQKEPKVIEALKAIVPKIIKTLPVKVEKKKKIAQPKIVIIIDDVTSKGQISLINKIPYPITMSFLPPTSRHKNSAKIAKDIPIYMIHLPLEASSRRYEESGTLYTTNTIDTIDKRIKSLKALYPKAKYINNHTGSKFTSDNLAMDKLLGVLKKYNYIFVDSRTIAKTKTKYNAKKHNLRYLSRNVFLDNKRDKQYIQKQLLKAVRIAKKNGYSIAIGHPHTITLKTLAQSKHLLKGLDVVLVDKL